MKKLEITHDNPSGVSAQHVSLMHQHIGNAFSWAKPRATFDILQNGVAVDDDFSDTVQQ